MKNNKRIRTARPTNGTSLIALDRRRVDAPVEPEGFITKEALAMRLSRTVRTVENWQRRGIIPYVKCGRCVLFKWTDVETHLQTHFRICGQNRQPKPPVTASRSFGVPPLGGSLPSHGDQPITDNGLSRPGLAEVESLTTGRAGSLSSHSSIHPTIH